MRALEGEMRTSIGNFQFSGWGLEASAREFGGSARHEGDGGISMADEFPGKQELMGTIADWQGGHPHTRGLPHHTVTHPL